jgi:hypothetical protein
MGEAGVSEEGFLVTPGLVTAGKKKKIDLRALQRMRTRPLLFAHIAARPPAAHQHGTTTSVGGR